MAKLFLTGVHTKGCVGHRLVGVFVLTFSCTTLPTLNESMLKSSWMEVVKTSCQSDEKCGALFMIVHLWPNGGCRDGVETYFATGGVSQELCVSWTMKTNVLQPHERSSTVRLQLEYAGLSSHSGPSVHTQTTRSIFTRSILLIDLPYNLLLFYWSHIQHENTHVK